MQTLINYQTPKINIFMIINIIFKNSFIAVYSLLQWWHIHHHTENVIFFLIKTNIVFFWQNCLKIIEAQKVRHCFTLNEGMNYLKSSSTDVNYVVLREIIHIK